MSVTDWLRPLLDVVTGAGRPPRQDDEDAGEHDSRAQVGLSHFFGCVPLGPVAWGIALASAAGATATTALSPLS